MPITIPIEIGDVIRVGKFKNKRITVKEIGLDDYQLPTVNGKGIMKIRIEKLIPPKEPKKEISEQIGKQSIKFIGFRKNNDGKAIEYIESITQDLGKEFKGPVIKFGFLNQFTGMKGSKEKGWFRVNKSNIRWEKYGVIWEEGTIQLDIKQDIQENNMKIRENKAKLDKMIREALHSNDTQVKIKQKDKLWWICQEETDEYLNAVGFETKEQAEHSALTKGYSFSGQENMNEIEPEVLTTKKEKTKGVDKVEDMKLDNEKEIKLEILRIAKRVIKEEMANKPFQSSYKNKFFVFDEKGNLVAAQSTVRGTVNYYKKGRKVFKGTPENQQEREITPIIQKLTFEESFKKKVNLTELEVTDPDKVKKIEEMARLSDSFDRLKAEMEKIKKQLDPLDEEITKWMDEADAAGERALETKNILITIKRKGNPSVEVAAYKERFERLYSRVNGALKKQEDEFWAATRKFKSVPTSIGVQYKQQESLMNEDNILSQSWNKIKSFFSNLYNKIIQYGKVADQGIAELHKLTGV